MTVTEPALPVDPSLPGEPALAEVNATRWWLGRRGVRVWLPTRLLALRVGGRALASRSMPKYGFLVVSLMWAALLTPGVPGPVRYLAVGALFAGYPLPWWRRTRARDRDAAARAPQVRVPLGAAVRQVGWWYLTSAVVTFAGGAALCAAIFVLAPQAWPEAAAWTAALAFGAASTVLVLAPVLRSPAIAEDGASLAVDAVLRAEDALMFAPVAPFALLALIDLAVAHPAAPEWFPFRVGYVILAAAMYVAARAHVGLPLPPGFYGR